MPQPTQQLLTPHPDLVTAFQRDGVCAVADVVAAHDVPRLRDAALRAVETVGDSWAGAAFTQVVDAWRTEPDLAAYALGPRLAALATGLAGGELRLWHDQVLIKPPHNGAATEFHQDAPYWPLDGLANALSVWTALVDVPAERGCMTFIPGSQKLRSLPATQLTEHDALRELAPHLDFEPRVTLPLRAGSCTVHDARTAHTATANATDEPRVAYVAIFVDADAVYTGAPHQVTDGLDLVVGEPLPDERFPRLVPSSAL